ncbi:MAG: glycosyltransferase family 4 protein [Aulosira sp. ZfuVER01]|nr:glycosyltransferase family 4 protein [Aulosira sp. ZfuVER01]MDZ7997277.1 glycosyltransferase family 4 protein [Aulosira sp. DedVER01a]MDZ8055554.1 glycosyltransferase family 4 protein [Aulosira sp. ZfuCHP01]
MMFLIQDKSKSITKKLLGNIRNHFNSFMKRINAYRFIYLISYIHFLLKRLRQNKRDEENKFDIVFVIDNGNRGWILEAICKEIALYFPGKSTFIYDTYFPGHSINNYLVHLPENSYLPPAKAYFFAHYSYFAVCLKLEPILWGSKNFIFYTHPSGIIDDKAFSYIMNKSTKVIAMCSEFAKNLINCGVESQKVTYVLGAANPYIFQPHERFGNGAVGFCTAYYPRKDPDRIFKIVKSMPHRKFILLGKGWEQYENFSELIALSNLAYIKAAYFEYPQYYAAMDVFVSPAKLEGGPIPLIEAMMCNVVPVASNTGFAPDIINNGDNGFLFDVDSPCELICDLIEKAFQNKTDIRKTVENLSWENFSLEIQKLLKYE